MSGKELMCKLRNTLKLHKLTDKQITNFLLMAWGLEDKEIIAILNKL